MMSAEIAAAGERRPVPYGEGMPSLFLAPVSFISEDLCATTSRYRARQPEVAVWPSCTGLGARGAGPTPATDLAYAPIAKFRLNAADSLSTPRGRLAAASSAAGESRCAYGAFELIGTNFTELDWKTLIFFERAVPISPNA